MTGKIWMAVKGLWYYTIGHIFALFVYDKKYLKGKWFSGKAHGLCALGWKWVVHDAFARIGSSDNKDARFPVNQKCRVVCPENIQFDPDDLNNFQSIGIYFQAIGKITIGKGTFLGPNVGLITSNHDLLNPEQHLPPKEITLGKACWIGMNSVILPGVVLGDHTVVGAGSVVTKSFPDGYCVIAGNPAKLIRRLEPNLEKLEEV